MLGIRPPRFTVGGILLVTAAVSLGFAVSQSPKADAADGVAIFNNYFADRRWLHGLEASAGILHVFEFVRQILAMVRQRSTIAHELQTAFWISFSQRIVLAVAICVLLLTRMLVMRKVISLPEPGENLLWATLWPDLLLSLTLLAGFRLLLVKKGKPVTRPGLRIAVNSLVVYGAIFLVGYTLIDRMLIPALIHIAIQGIERAEPISLQRTGAFPNQLAEGYRSFWYATAAAGSVLVAIGFLIFDIVCKRSWLRWFTRSAFTLLLAGLGAYAWWFATSEFPRLNPDMASVGFPMVWTDVLAGGFMLIGTAWFGGILSARLRDSRNKASIELPNRSGLVTLAACAIVMAEGWGLVENFREIVSISSFLGPPDLLDILHSIGYMFTTGETLIPTLLLVSAITLLWQVYRRPDAVCTLVPIKINDVLVYTIAWFALLLFAIPTLAAFGFCWWLGPFV